jgi:hypothetical protein
MGRESLPTSRWRIESNEHVGSGLERRGSSCLTEWDLQDGDIILTDMEEAGVGIHGGLGPSHRGGPQQRKRRFGFLKKKPIPFEKS